MMSTYPSCRNMRNTLIQWVKEIAIPKTDPDATFMYMKKGHMRRASLNRDIIFRYPRKKQFITNYAFYYNPDDTLTLISFLSYARWNSMWLVCTTEAVNDNVK